MCSNASLRPPGDDLAARLLVIIDELAAVAGSSGRNDGSEDLAGKLAAVWALVAAADPELADRTAKYAR